MPDDVAIGVLIAFGSYTLLSSEAEEEEKAGRLAQTRGWAAVAFGLSISLESPSCSPTTAHSAESSAALLAIAHEAIQGDALAPLRGFEPDELFASVVDFERRVFQLPPPARPVSNSPEAQRRRGGARR